MPCPFIFVFLFPLVAVVVVRRKVGSVANCRDIISFWVRQNVKAEEYEEEREESSTLLEYTVQNRKLFSNLFFGLICVIFFSVAYDDVHVDNECTGLLQAFQDAYRKKKCKVLLLQLIWSGR